MAPEKRSMFIDPDDIGRFATGAIIELENFSHLDHIPCGLEEQLASPNLQIDAQRWIWERREILSGLLGQVFV
ncbi:hypothetical protein PENVUL_c068G02910 [Penicillium vulpinum]|uniref:Uncharacterized protein n=1 Tax=Penicillium vulpinum TaxID=29845 RepID=A0A1V6RCK4_9EURO|nr:hypothetical protein PENVUL_c068G02910 [Penicillium vulpinum]